MVNETKTARKKDNRNALLLIFFVLLFGLAIGFLNYLTGPIVSINRPNIGVAAVGTAIHDVDTTSTGIQQAPPELEQESEPSTANNQPIKLPVFVLNYSAGDNGHLNGATTQKISYGGDGTAVTAVPNFGYHFANWSDGFTDNPRIDKTIIATTTVNANFAVNTYSLVYRVGSNGYLVGTTTQTVVYGNSGTAVTAVPNLDHKFINWSDGSTDNPRTDTAVESNISVMANFVFVYLGSPTRTPTPPAILSDIATITSVEYTVSVGGTTNETITGVPFGTDKATFLAALTKGQVNQSWNYAGIADPVVSDNTLVITAQDGTTVVTYTVTVSSVPPPPPSF